MVGCDEIASDWRAASQGENGTKGGGLGVEVFAGVRAGCGDGDGDGDGEKWSVG